MKQTDAANSVNALAVALLLLASLVFHVQRVLSAKEEALPSANDGRYFPGLAWQSLFPPSFPQMLLIQENFCHHKPIQHA